MRTQNIRKVGLKTKSAKVDNLVVAVVGPTATGKSDLAVILAKHLCGEVISADSRQVYKGLHIGTGKITPREMRGVPHHLLDIISPKKRFSVQEYATIAKKKILEIQHRDHVPIVCGGTGFYIQALIDDIVLPDVPPNEKLRKSLSLKKTDDLFTMLERKDPRRAKEMKKNGDFKNARRIIRALEIVATLGSVPKQEKNRNIKQKYKTIFIGLTLPPEELKERIHARLLARLKKGMVAEAKNLHKNGLSYKRMRELGLEYRHLAIYLESNQTKADKEKMIDGLLKDIYQYAKRQMTWFKRDKRIHWISPNTPLKTILELVYKA
jgi:tRNA dimethylallyltransferase